MKPTGNPRPRHVPWGRHIEAAAADWLARRHDGLTVEEANALQHWLASDQRHAGAFAELESFWSALNEPRLTGAAGTVRRALAVRERRRRVRRRVLAFAATGFGAAAALAFLFSTGGRDASPAVSTPTIVARPHVQVLTDGSTIELNAAAELNVEFTDDERRVRLIAGEALFQVAKQLTRPFVVVARDVEVRAVGTAFSVRHEAAQIQVLVTEGRVAVKREKEPAAIDVPRPPVFVDAGARVRMPASCFDVEPSNPEPVTPADVSRALAWRGRRIEFTGTPLLEAMELFNVQNRVQLAANAAIGARRITGIFWSDDPEGFARLLESGLNMKAERVGDRIVLHER